MKLLGFELSLRRKARIPDTLQSLSSTGGGLLTSGGWWSMFGPIRESFTGAWQRNVVVAPTPTLLAFSPIFACVTGIAGDIAKMCVELVREEDGVTEEISDAHGNSDQATWLALLEQPNRYQNRIQFFQSWMISKLLYGNAYILKERNDRGIVSKLYVLEPTWVVPLIADDGSVYYQLNRDALAQVQDQIVVPQSEIIHDRMATLWHPLIGISPLYACGMSGTMGNSIQINATRFFNNRSMPGGMLTAPGKITNDVAQRLKDTFTANYSGENIGKLFVAGDGLEFKPFMIDAQHAQQVEQLGWTVLDVARAFKYPAWKIGGPMPPYTKPELLQTSYYTDCLQEHIEAIELLLELGLELPDPLECEFDLDGLLRLDTDSLFDSNNKGANWLTIDEMRYRANYKPLPVGGDTVYRQEQDHSIVALAERDASPDPFKKGATSAPAASTSPTPPPTPAPAAAKHVDDEPIDPQVMTKLFIQFAK